MAMASLPPKSAQVLLKDSIHRDLTTARRAALLGILLHQRYLTREQLMQAVEWRLGRDCFGKSAWADTFYRDMRVVKAALKAEGYQPAYSRSAARQGYYLRGEPAFSEKMIAEIRAAQAEIDMEQVEVLKKKTPAERFRMAISATKLALDSVTYRYQHRHPNLSWNEARYQVLQRAYQR